MANIREFFDYRWNPVLFAAWSYSYWIRTIWAAWRKDVAKAKETS